MTTITFIFFMIMLYGYFDKMRKENLMRDFNLDKKIECGDMIIQKSQGWSIKSNRFFTNGKIYKTIVFCSTE